MEIKGKVHCFFEQTGTFKNEFIKLGIPAEDYDIQNNFGQTDHVIDIFEQIELAYNMQSSIFDQIKSNTGGGNEDLIIAFFPCIYFECLSMLNFNWKSVNYRKLSYDEKTRKIIARAGMRYNYYILILKLVEVVMRINIRLIIENPYSLQHYFKQGNFVKKPDFIDKNRMLRGDYFIKPTAYWFFNCSPEHGFTPQNDKNQISVIGSRKKGVKSAKKSPHAGLCSEERSMISSDYARNFICDNILGITQKSKEIQTKLLL